MILSGQSQQESPCGQSRESLSHVRRLRLEEGSAAIRFRGLRTEVRSLDHILKGTALNKCLVLWFLEVELLLPKDTTFNLSLGHFPQWDYIFNIIIKSIGSMFLFYIYIYNIYLYIITCNLSIHTYFYRFVCTVALYISAYLSMERKSKLK